ncbi:HI0074 family nucleotidyltransferase substrate-binding subunit [Candidatus Palauibacter sp.]|uniref:HI0074 family nucleotidyltransferase substrate-binding subunit n=1 Tax=Candidatus Palauibacter sp. TaxID=3101350 RepID=UPI003B021CA8
MKLDFSPLTNAVGQLERSLAYLNSDLAREDAGLREQFRAAAIQAFEFSYELSVKMIRRQLAAIVARPAALHQIDFADLMRDAADAGIIRDARTYIRYREMRNRTSHTYNADRAEEAVVAMPGFLGDMQLLLAELEQRNA